MATPEQPQRDELIAAVKSMAPFPILMATFMLVYAVWFGVAWSVIGWAVFALFGVYAVWLIFCGVQHIRVTKKLPKPAPTPASKRIAKQMQLLSAVSYTPLWIIIVLFCIFQQQIYIMPALVLIVGLHFIPQAKIFDRTIDYYLAPLPICTALIGFYLAFATSTSWQAVYAISSIGGALATAGYGLYMVLGHKQLMNQINHA